MFTVIIKAIFISSLTIFRYYPALIPQGGNGAEKLSSDAEYSNAEPKDKEPQEESTKIKIVDVTEDDMNKTESKPSFQSGAVDSKKVFDILNCEKKISEENVEDIPFITAKKSTKADSIFAPDNIDNSSKSNNFVDDLGNEKPSTNRLFYKRNVTEKKQTVLIEDITNVRNIIDILYF